MGRLQQAAEMRRALQLFLAKLDPDTELDSMLEVPTMFPAWEVGKLYAERDVFAYGENGVGDPQLWQVLQEHVSSEHYAPGAATSLYKAIGVTEEGYPEWVQPLGATDAYSAGDVVSHNGQLYVSTVDANVWEPGIYGWEVYGAETA